MLPITQPSFSTLRPQIREGAIMSQRLPEELAKELKVKPDILHTTVLRTSIRHIMDMGFNLNWPKFIKQNVVPSLGSEHSEAGQRRILQVFSPGEESCTTAFDSNKHRGSIFDNYHTPAIMRKVTEALRKAGLDVERLTPYLRASESSDGDIALIQEVLGLKK
jgi:hypothetical protein